MSPLPKPDAALQLVVFDLMGTLITDDGVVHRAYERALAQAGIVPGSEAAVAARATIDALRGRPTLVVLTEVIGDAVMAEEATWAFDDSILDSVSNLVEVPGAGRVLHDLHNNEILTAVTTSFTPEVRKAVLAHMGWTDSFAATLSAHGVRRGHPAPDLLLHAILDLRIDSVAQVAIVGDSATDLEAGNRAGAGLVVGVRSGGATESDLRSAPHTHLVDSVADLPAILHAPRTDGQRRTSDR